MRRSDLDDLDRLPVLGTLIGTLLGALLGVCAGLVTGSAVATIAGGLGGAGSAAYLGHEIGVRVAWRRWRAAAELRTQQAAELRTQQARIKRAETTACAPLCTCAKGGPEPSEQISALRRRAVRFVAAVELQTALRSGEYGDPWTSGDVDPADVQRLRESAILAGIRGCA